ncbi:MAG: tetratricopeptide repeat protein [Planctomycetaceae bacterium]
MRAVLLILGVALSLSSALRADDAPAAATESSPEARPVYSTGQPADEPITVIKPERPRTDAEQTRLDAIAHYMAGELYLERGDEDALKKAIHELSQAIDLNPEAIEPYRLLIPAAVRAGDGSEAQKYALLATERAPDGVQLLRALVAVYANQGELPAAIAALEKSRELKGLPADSFARLILLRHLGQCYTADDEPDKAAAAYKELFSVLQPEPEGLKPEEMRQLIGEKGEVYEEIGNAFFAAKLPEDAVTAYRVSAEKHGRSPGLHSFNLAQVFQQTGKPERALEELQHYFDAQHIEKGRAPYQLLEELLQELNRGDELFPRLKALAEKDKHNKFLHHFLASELVAQGDLEAAEKIYQQMGGPADPESLLGLASIDRRQGKYQDWIKTASRAFIILQLNNSALRKRLSQEIQDIGDRFEQDLAELAENQEQTEGILKAGRELSSGEDPTLEFEQAWLLGRLAVEAKATDDAARFYRYAINMQNLPAYDLFRELGAYYIDQKRYADAEKTFQDAADHPALEPLRFFFMSLVSVAREMDGRIEPALEAIKESRRLAPKESQFAIQEARIYYRARRWDEAISIFEGILQDFRDDADTVRECRFSLSAVLVQKGDYDKGEQILQDVLALEPDHPQANNDLGYLWADRDKNLDQALEMVTKALKAEPDNAAYKDSMGWVLYRLGKYDESAKYLEEASSVPRGEDATIFDHLGDVRAKQGQQDKATAAWKRALELEKEKSVPDPKMLETLERKLPTEVDEPAPEKKP